MGGVGSALAVDPATAALPGRRSATADLQGRPQVRRERHFLYDFDLPGSITWLDGRREGDLSGPRGLRRDPDPEVARERSTKSATTVLSMGSGGTGPGKLGRLNGIDVDADGNAYVVDAGNHTVHVFGPTGTGVSTWATRTSFPGDMRGVVVDDGTGRVYVANSQAGTIEVFDTAGTHLSTFASLGTAAASSATDARQLTSRLTVTCGRRLRRQPGGGVHRRRRVRRRLPRAAAAARPCRVRGARGVAVDPHRRRPRRRQLEPARVPVRADGTRCKPSDSEARSSPTA